MDHKDYNMNIEDIFLRSVEKREVYDRVVNDMLPLRNEIVELSQNIDSTIEPEVTLQLEKVIGRKAFNRRKKLVLYSGQQPSFFCSKFDNIVKHPTRGLRFNPRKQKNFLQRKFPKS